MGNSKFLLTLCQLFKASGYLYLYALDDPKNDDAIDKIQQS